MPALTPPKPDALTRLRSSVVRRPLAAALLVAAVLAHAAMVGSIARQPLGGGIAAQRQRPWIWGLHNDTVHRAGPAADFLAVYEAGLHAGEGRSPYTREPRPGLPFHYRFRYLPPVAWLLGAPLSTLPPRAAWWLWIAACELLLLACIVALARRMPGPPGTAAALLLLLASPYFLELYMGQFTFATCTLAVLALLRLERGAGLGSGLAAAASLAASFLLKVFPVVVLPALWRRRDALAVGIAASAVLIALALPGFAAHSRDWAVFYADNFEPRLDGLDAGNYGLPYVLHLLAGGLGVAWSPATWLRFARLWQAGLLAATALLVLASRQPSLLLGAATLLLAHFLSYTHVWEHHMSGALLVVLAAASVFARRAERRALAWLFGASLLLALPTPFALLDRELDPRVWDPAAGWPLAQRLLLPACKALPLLAAYAVCVASLLRAGVGWPRAPQLSSGR
jgi:hypothetical protein